MKLLNKKANIFAFALCIVAVLILGGWIAWRNLHGTSNTVSPKEVAEFSHQFAEQIREQHSLVDSLSAVAAEQQNTHLQQVLMQVNHTVMQGYPLSMAMSQHPDVFNQDYVNKVRVGEKTGSLDQALQFLAKSD